MSTADAPLLSIEQLSLRFGGVVAIDNLSCDVAKGSITGLIGPNGSGKTTLINTITGLYGPDSGRIAFAGASIEGRKPHQIARLGIGRTFQITRLFGDMTVLENLLIAKMQQKGETVLFGFLQPSSVGEEEAQTKKRALELLDFIGLSTLKDANAANLSYGQQKLLEIARVMMLNPSLILLDEPFAGVNPTNIERLASLILELNRDMGVTIILVEHMMKIMMRLAQRIIVLQSGSLIAEGTPAEVQSNEAAIRAYLGD